jgi:uncharacterized membrane protein
MSESKPSGFSDNAIGAIAYITFVPAIAFLVLRPYNKSSYVRFHAWQSILLSCVFYIVTTLLSMVFSMFFATAAYAYATATWLVWACWLLLWIFCAIKAINGRRFMLPILGALAEKQAVD